MGCWGPRVDINEYFHPWHGSMFFHTLATPTLDMTITTGCLCLLVFFSTPKRTAWEVRYLEFHLSNQENLGWLGYIGDFSLHITTRGL